MACGVINRRGPVAIAAIHLRADLCCAYCGSDLSRTPVRLRHTDHVLPISLGGTDDPANLVLACSRCNSGRAGADLLPLRAVLRGRTRAEVRRDIERQTSIAIGPGSKLHEIAIEHAWRWWPDQMARRARARAGYLERQAAARERDCVDFFEGLARARVAPMRSRAPERLAA